MRQITVAVDGFVMTPTMLAQLVQKTMAAQGVNVDVMIGQGMHANGIPDGTILLTKR
jgi:hypothetical protein